MDRVEMGGSQGLGTWGMAVWNDGNAGLVMCVGASEGQRV